MNCTLPSVILPDVRGCHRLKHPLLDFADDEEELCLPPVLLFPQVPSMLGRGILCHPIPAIKINYFNTQLKILMHRNSYILVQQKIRQLTIPMSYALQVRWKEGQGRVKTPKVNF